VKIFTDFWIRT